MAAICVSPVSATWIDKGTVTNTGVNGNTDYRVAVQQTTHYYYNDQTGQWREDISATGTAQKFDWRTLTWGNTYGSFGVYGLEDGNLRVWTTYGDKTVTYTSTIRSPITISGTGTIYSGSFYVTPPSSGNYVSVEVAGVVNSFGAVSTTTKNK
jgi:hypothetical protein